MLKYLQYLKNNTFEILLCLSILFIILYSLYRKIKGLKGKWSDRYYLPKKDMSKEYTKFQLDPVKQIDYENNNHRKNKKADSKGETECRRVLSKLFNLPFNKARPDFLRNKVTGGLYNLELDCYAEELGLACEYDGIAHAKFVPYFHANKEAFLNQKYRDEMKDRLCDDNNITLIRVPHDVKLNDIESFLINKLRNVGYKV